MVENVITGKGMYVYWGKSTTWKSGDPTSDEQLPFNPITEEQGITLPKALYDIIATLSDDVGSIELDLRLEPNVVKFRTFFRDFFLLSALFTHKEITESWSGTGDVVTMDFTDRTHVCENIWVQIHLEGAGGSNDVDIFLDGGQITDYKWIINEGKAMVEEASIKFAEVALSSQAVDIDDGLDDESFNADGLDGGWSLWDSQLCASKKAIVHASDCTLTVDGSAPTGIKLKEGVFNISAPKEYDFVQSSKTADTVYEGVKKYSAAFRGILSGNQMLSEVIAHLSSKSKATIKFQYAANKYIQFTIGVLDGVPGLAIPKAGEANEITYEYKSAGDSVCSFSWTGNVAKDPSPYIEHSNPT